MSLAVQRDLDEVRDGLRRWLGRPVGAIERPAPGWSCETLLVEGELVVRLPPMADGIFPVYDLGQQAAVQSAVGTAGVPVADPVRYEPDPGFLGAPFVVMPFVDGVVPGEFTAGDQWLTGLSDDRARSSLWSGFLATLGAIHRAPTAGLGLRTGLDAELGWWERYVSWATDGAPPTALADALAWCRSNRPVVEPPASLLWGDVRLGNVIFDADTLAPRAVLDWDMASVGPAELDLGWLLALEAVQTEMTGMTVPGFPEHDETVDVFETITGRPLVDIGWFEIYAMVRASAVSTRIALLFQRAGQRSMFRVGEDPTLAAAVARIDRR